VPRENPRTDGLPVEERARRLQKAARRMLLGEEET